MSNLLAECIAEARGLEKKAEAPQEAPTPEQQNADVLESSQAMISKIDSFLQGISGQGTDDGTMDQGGTGTGPVADATTGDPNDPSQAGTNSVHIEVPAGMSVKLGSCEVEDSDSALRTIIGLMPSYFGE